MGEHPYLRPMRGHLKEKPSVAPEEGGADGEDQEDPPAPKRRKREISPASRQRKEEVQEIKRWKNQIRMKLAAGKIPDRELIGKAYFRDIRLETGLFPKEFVFRRGYSIPMRWPPWIMMMKDSATCDPSLLASRIPEAS